MTASMVSEASPRDTGQPPRSRTGAPACYRALWVTSAVSGTDHAVTEEGMSEAARAGRCPAVCGAHVPAASLAAPPGPRCHRCLARLRGWPASAEEPKRGRHAVRRHRLLDRLLHRPRQTPVAASPLPPAVHPGRGDRSRTTAGPGPAGPTLVPPWSVREAAGR